MSATLRNVVCFIVCAALLAVRATAQSPSYERALAAYQAGDYATARSEWLTALDDESIDRAAVLYDLGNVAVREKHPLQAAAWYTASLRLAPRDAEARHNLEFARREAGLEPDDRGDLRSTARRLVTMLTLVECERLLFALAAALAAAFAWEALRGGTAAKAACWVLVSAVVLALVPWSFQNFAASHAPVFVTQPEGAALLSEPREAAALIGRLPPASEAERLDALPGWTRVVTPEGTRGWIRADSCVELASNAAR